MSGALIQAATRNPLANPGILGVNAGSAFFVTLAVDLLGWQSIDTYIWAAFARAHCTGTTQEGERVMTETPSTCVGTGHIVAIRFFGDCVSLRVHRRGLLVGFALIALILLVAIASLTRGSY